MQTIYLSYNEVLEMDDAKRNALKDLFPNLSNTIFLDADNYTMGVPGIKQSPIVTKKPFQCANLARRLGFPATAKIPSLQSLVAFFVKENNLEVTTLREHLQSIVKNL